MSMTNKPTKTSKRASLRLAAARDVILQLRIGKYMAKAGTLISFNRALRRSDVGTRMNDVINRPDVTCTACQKGAMLLSLMRMGSHVGESIFPHDVGHNGVSDIHNRLAREIGASQVCLVEDAFERRTSSLDLRDNCGVSHFGKIIPDDTRRMYAICRNIISNKGTFRPMSGAFAVNKDGEHVRKPRFPDWLTKSNGKTPASKASQRREGAAK